MRESDFHLDDGALVDDTRPRLALVYEKFMACDLDSLTFFNVTDVPAKEARLQDLLSDQLDGLALFSIRSDVCLLSWPDGGDTHYAHALRHARVHLDFSTV